MDRAEAIRHFEYGVSHDIFKEPVTSYAKMAIAALREQESLAQATSEWISVDERLPELYRPVLVCKKRLDSPECYMTTDRRVILYGDDTVWSSELLTWKNSVTHWMPLPEPPKEGAEG